MRVDAISQVVFDPSGKQTGELYPAHATHFFGEPVRCPKQRKSSSQVVDTKGSKKAKNQELAP